MKLCTLSSETINALVCSVILKSVHFGKWGIWLFMKIREGNSLITFPFNMLTGQRKYGCQHCIPYVLLA